MRSGRLGRTLNASAGEIFLNISMTGRILSIDTSVIGGYFDAEFAEATRRLWQLAQRGFFTLRTSEVTATEIANAPGPIRRLFAASFTQLIKLNPDTVALASAYVAHKIVPPKYHDDALHVAACSLAGISPLVSWNFKHLVNLRREDGFNAVNLLHGRPTLRIVSPLELIYENEI